MRHCEGVFCLMFCCVKEGGTFFYVREKIFRPVEVKLIFLWLNLNWRTTNLFNGDGRLITKYLERLVQYLHILTTSELQRHILRSASLVRLMCTWEFTVRCSRVKLRRTHLLSPATSFHLFTLAWIRLALRHPFLIFSYFCWAFPSPEGICILQYFGLACFCWG